MLQSIALGPGSGLGFWGWAAGAGGAIAGGLGAPRDPQPAAVLALDAQEDVGRGPVCPGGTRVQQPADPSREPSPPSACPGAGGNWDLPNLRHPQPAALGLRGLGAGVSAAMEDEERQVRPLHTRGFTHTHTPPGVGRVGVPARVLRVDGDRDGDTGTGMGTAVPSEGLGEEARGAPRTRQGPQT